MYKNKNTDVYNLFNLKWVELLSKNLVEKI